jgi:outer membrane protein OmpA-like peptidoglycan-associated protein
MRQLMSLTFVLLASSVGCAGSQANTPSSTAARHEVEAADTTSPVAAADSPRGDAPASDEFVVRTSERANNEHTQTASKLKPTRTEAAMKFTVVDKDKGPIRGIVIALTAPGDKKFYTEETNVDGYAEVLVPVGQKYELLYLGLGRRDIAAKVAVTDEPNQNIRLTLRYKRYEPPTKAGAEPAAAEPRFVLEGVTFESGKATLRQDSYARLDGVVEYMTHKKSARIEISGHTDNAGKPKTNKLLSEKRAEACRDYLVSKGIEAERIRAVGYGDERPIGSNDTEAGREQNRRIEATEL